MRSKNLVILALASSLAACYHATVETGLTPSDQVVRENWAPSWIIGLIRPPIMNVAQQCPRGVARVETEHSFLNQLVNYLTIGIFTPMTIVATCASGEPEGGRTEWWQ